MRIRRPDHKNASSIIEEAEREMKFTLTLTPSGESASTIVRNIYECFRMLGDALLTIQGREFVEKDHHIEAINTLLKLNVDTIRPINSIENLRGLRRNINYYGYRPSVAETNDAVDIAKKCFPALADAVKKEIKKNMNAVGENRTRDTASL